MERHQRHQRWIQHVLIAGDDVGERLPLLDLLKDCAGIALLHGLHQLGDGAVTLDSFPKHVGQAVFADLRLLKCQLKILKHLGIVLGRHHPLINQTRKRIGICSGRHELCTGWGLARQQVFYLRCVRRC